MEQRVAGDARRSRGKACAGLAAPVGDHELVVRSQDQRSTFKRKSFMPRMKVVQVAKPNAILEVVERDIPEPKQRQVRIKVQACGVCHSDMFTDRGPSRGIQY